MILIKHKIMKINLFNIIFQSHLTKQRNYIQIFSLNVLFY